MTVINILKRPVKRQFSIIIFDSSDFTFEKNSPVSGHIKKSLHQRINSADTV